MDMDRLPSIPEDVEFCPDVWTSKPPNPFAGTAGSEGDAALLLDVDLDVDLDFDGLDFELAIVNSQIPQKIT
jgi:hypothetical protein